jgi:UDP-glucose 6-dehydrogenase
MMKRILEKDDKISDVHIAFTTKECLEGADGCILVTDWSEYRKACLDTLVAPMRTKIFIDGRRVFAKDKIPKNTTYRTIGVLSICNTLSNSRM